MRCLGTSCTDVLGHPSLFGLALVVPGGVEGELADEFAVFIEDADVEIVGEHEDAGAGETSSEADVVELAVVAQRDHAAGIDAIATHAVVPIGDRLSGRVRSGAGSESFCRCAAA